MTAFLDPASRLATVKVTVLDQNDNSPVFQFGAGYNSLLPNTYLASLPEGVQPGAEIARVQVCFYNGKICQLLNLVIHRSVTVTIV